MLWNVVFDLHVPGWLPSTAAFGEGGGIRYTLHAEARFTKVDDSINGGSSFLSNLCSAFRSKTRIAHAPMCDIVINRFTCPAAAPLSPTSPFPISSYAVELQPSSNSRAIPSEVLESISAFAFIPDCISIDDDSVPLSLRLCTNWRNKEQCDQLRITDVSIEIEQLEHYQFVSLHPTSIPLTYRFPRTAFAPPAPTCQPTPSRLPPNNLPLSHSSRQTLPANSMNSDISPRPASPPAPRDSSRCYRRAILFP
jgi:hypothetical protein